MCSSDLLGLNGCGLRAGEPAGGPAHDRFAQGRRKDGTVYDIDTASPETHDQIRSVIQRVDGPLDQRGSTRLTPFNNTAPNGGGSPLPLQERGYYQKTDLWDPKTYGKTSERLIFSRGGEVYYSPDHYHDFRRVR